MPKFLIITLLALTLFGAFGFFVNSADATHEWRCNIRFFSDTSCTSFITSEPFCSKSNVLFSCTPENYVLGDGTPTKSHWQTSCIVSSSCDHTPTADAGPDQTVTDSDANGSEVVTLNGWASSDPDGFSDIAGGFVWKEGATTIGTGPGPSVTLSVGAHTITLTVTDGSFNSDTDTVVIKVKIIVSVSHACDVTVTCPADPPTTLDKVTFKASAVSSAFTRIVYVSLNGGISYTPLACSGGSTCSTLPQAPYADGQTVIYYAVYYDPVTGDEVGQSGIKSFTVSDNKPPVVSITAPPDGSSFTAGDPVGFTGSATDPEDGVLTGKLSWSSSINGPIGSGGSFSKSSLSVGTHTITASVTDSRGRIGTDTISIKILAAPVVCSDPDGANTTSAGTCTDSTPPPDTDSCVTLATVKEWQCVSNTCTASSITCGAGKECLSGACVDIAAVCTDPDGANTAIKGTCTDASGPDTDSCATSATVKEWQCVLGACTVSTLSCGSGKECSDGKCVDVVPPPCGGLGQGCCASGDPCLDDFICNADSKCVSPPPPPPSCVLPNTCVSGGSCAVVVAGDCGAGNECCAPPPPGKPGGLVPCGRLIDIGTPNENCTFCHFFTLFKNIIDFIMWTLAPILGLLFIVLGGFLILTSRGSPMQFNQGKLFIIWALGGFVLILIAWIIINSIFAVLNLQDWTKLGTWWKVTCTVPTTVVESPPPPPPPLVASGCADGTTEQDFGTTSAGKNVHGCNGRVAYSDVVTKCAVGWHVGDVILDTGLSVLLATNQGTGLAGEVARWVHMKGDPGDQTGYDFASPGVRCWGSPLAGGCLTSVEAFRPAHSGSSLHEMVKTYFNGNLATTGYVVNASPAFGAICVEGPPPPPPPPPSGCADGTTEQNFGALPDGRIVHGCNGSKTFQNAPSLCAAGATIGDLWPSSNGLGAILQSQVGNSPRWVYLNGDPGSLTGYTNTANWWGNPHGGLLPTIPNLQRPLHHAPPFGTNPFGPNGESDVYLNNVLFTNHYVGNNDASFLTGAICVGSVPPLGAAQSERFYSIDITAPVINSFTATDGTTTVDVNSDLAWLFHRH